MTPTQLNEIKQRVENATQGPWKVEPSEGDCGSCGECPKNLDYCDEGCSKCEHYEIYQGTWLNGPNYVEYNDYSYYTDSDADFIAHARQDIPSLLEHISELLEKIEQLEADKNELSEKIGQLELAAHAVILNQYLNDDLETAIDNLAEVLGGAENECT